MNNKKGHPVKSSPKQINTNGKAIPRGKIEGMFIRFAKGERHHRFTAERLGDSCLPTTISDLQRRYKKQRLYFSREPIMAENRFGGKARLTCYWLGEINLKKARKILGLDKVRK